MNPRSLPQRGKETLSKPSDDRVDALLVGQANRRCSSVETAEQIESTQLGIVTPERHQPPTVRLRLGHAAAARA
jgi:hypothetical protein